MSLKFSSSEKATNYKNDGNVNFKNSKYRWAIDNYNVAIQCRCPDKQLNAICYTNRAAAQYRLGKTRSLPLFRYNCRGDWTSCSLNAYIMMIS